MRLSVLVAVATAALLAVSARALQPKDCNLSDPASLSRCLKQLLLSARDKVRHEYDPFHLPGFKDGDDFEAKDIVVRGLSAYSVPNLSVTFPQPQQIALSATISWPSLTGDMSVHIHKCKKIIWNWCISLSATPHVTVDSTSGSLKTTLTVNVDSKGRVTVRPSSTSVSLNLSSIQVKANLSNTFLHWVNKILGDPASKIASRIANKWWRENKPKIEAKAREALDKAVKEHVSVKLADLLPKLIS